MINRFHSKFLCGPAVGYGVLILFVVLVACGDALARKERDSTEVDNREFMRLLQKADELNEEQKWRAKRTQNPRILARLARDEHPGVRFYVAFNPATPEDALMDLSGDPNETVRWAVAMNASIPDQAMKDLATDYAEIVRLGLAANPRVAPDVLKELAADVSVTVRRKVAALVQ